MLKKWLKEYINRNIYDILIVLIMLVIGIVVGVGIYMFASNDSKELLITSARSIFELSKNEAYIKTNIILNGLEMNVLLLAVLLVSSMTLFGKYLIQFIVILKGMAISVYTIVLFKIFGLGYGILSVALLILLVNLIYLPAFIYLAVTFLEINFNIFKTKIANVSMLEKLGILGKIGVAFTVIFSSIVVEQIASSVVLTMFLKVG